MVSSNQRAIVEAGKKIYERHRVRLEAEARGQFAVIDIASEELFIAPSPEEASRKARAGGADWPVSSRANRITRCLSLSARFAWRRSAVHSLTVPLS
jgi:hypothetical protein